MTPSGTDPNGSSFTPEEAYAALGHEVRIQIIKVLHDADEPLSFSELFNRIDYDTASNFAYHLNQLTDPFVKQTEAGYSLTWTGKLVARSAILAGQVAAQSRIEPTGIDASCPLCGAGLLVSYGDNIMQIRCIECVGLWEHGPSGLVITFNVPPMSLGSRTLGEAFYDMAGKAFGDITSIASGCCPVCASTVERSVSVCDDHDATHAYHCDACTHHFATAVRHDCDGCRFGISKLPASLVLLADGSLDDVLATYGIRFPRGWDAYKLALGVEEDILDSDPVRLRLSFPVDEGLMTVTVDGDLNVLGHELTGSR